MQIKRLKVVVLSLSAALVLAMLVPAMLRAADEKPAPADHSHAGHDHGAAGASDHEKLEESMKSAEQAFKALRKQINDPSKNESSIALAVKFQQAAIVSKGITPPMIAKLPADKQADAKLSYRQMMVNLVRHALDMEEHLINNDNKKAAAALEEMHKLEHAGHDEFRPKKPK